MLEVKPITPELPEIQEIKGLYARSFPENERIDFEKMINDTGEARDMLAFYDGGAFVGFACLLNSNGISHIIYLAIEEKLRSRGYGTQALITIHRFKAGHRIMVDIERQRNDCDNNEQRLRRKEFYLRNGYSETEIKYRWRDEDYEILVYGGDLPEQDYKMFWKGLHRHSAHRTNP